MRYAILQRHLEPPRVETLQQAFQNLKCLTAYDAHILANDAFGVLVKNLSGKDASAIQGALAAVGVETEMVPEKQLPPMPSAKLVRRAECSLEAFMIYDPAGRKFPVEWRHVTLIAAGSVRLSQFKTTETTRRVIRFDMRGHPRTETVTDKNTREERAFKLLLEVFLGRAVARYSIAADKFLYHYLGPRQAKAMESNFALLVRDLIHHAPHAVLNRGAYYIRDNPTGFLPYPTKNAFFEEITWMLWQMNRTARA